MVIVASCSRKTFTIGMSEESFLAQDHKVAKVSSTATETAYKKIDHGPGHLPFTKFLYFKNGKLVKTEENERQPAITNRRD